MRAPFLWFAAGAIGLGALFMTNKAKAAIAEHDTQYDALFKKWGAVYGVDWRLIKAHAIRETHLDPSAINAADPSYGLMQVLCEASSPDSHCRNVLYVDRWREATPAKLLEPDFNVQIAAQIIADNLHRFGMPRAVAVYNEWDQHTAPINGPFKNQSYVDDVLAIYEGLKNG